MGVDKRIVEAHHRRRRHEPGMRSGPRTCGVVGFGGLGPRLRAAEIGESSARAARSPEAGRTSSCRLFGERAKRITNTTTSRPRIDGRRGRRARQAGLCGGGGRGVLEREHRAFGDVIARA